MGGNARITTVFAILGGLFVLPFSASAWEMEGTKTIALSTRDGQSIDIGTVSFTPKDGKIGFDIALDLAKFKDYFLSMKEFKCLDGGVEVQCYVPYPYDNPHEVTADNLAWLEHSLLFLFKNPSEFGAKLWNGLYYRMTVTDQGIVGAPKAVDLNEIAAPPPDPSVPPFGAVQQGDIPAGTRWITGLTIK